MTRVMRPATVCVDPSPTVPARMSYQYIVLVGRYWYILSSDHGSCLIFPGSETTLTTFSISMVVPVLLTSEALFARSLFAGCRRRRAIFGSSGDKLRHIGYLRGGEPLRPQRRGLGNEDYGGGGNVIHRLRRDQLRRCVL